LTKNKKWITIRPRKELGMQNKFSDLRNAGVFQFNNRLYLKLDRTYSIGRIAGEEVNTVDFDTGELLLIPNDAIVTVD